MADTLPPGRAIRQGPSHVQPRTFGSRAIHEAGRGRLSCPAVALMGDDGDMLQIFGFDRIGVVLGDIYFIDPAPAKGQEGPEHGIRLEVRMLEPGELTGSIYSARPISITEPIWRADLLESADGPPGSLNRAHHHPNMQNWEPGRRVFDRDLSSDAVGFVGSKLADLEGLLTCAGIEVDDALVADARSLRSAVPDVQRALTSMLDRVKAGELGTAPGESDLTSARVSWL